MIFFRWISAVHPMHSAQVARFVVFCYCMILNDINIRHNYFTSTGKIMQLLQCIKTTMNGMDKRIKSIHGAQSTPICY